MKYKPVEKVQSFCPNCGGWRNTGINRGHLLICLGCLRHFSILIDPGGRYVALPRNWIVTTAHKP